MKASKHDGKQERHTRAFSPDHHSLKNPLISGGMSLARATQRFPVFTNKLAVQTCNPVAQTNPCLEKSSLSIRHPITVPA
jgi:hypothetical protein